MAFKTYFLTTNLQNDLLSFFGAFLRNLKNKVKSDSDLVCQ